MNQNPQPQVKTIKMIWQKKQQVQISNEKPLSSTNPPTNLQVQGLGAIKLKAMLLQIKLFGLSSMLLHHQSWLRFVRRQTRLQDFGRQATHTSQASLHKDEIQLALQIHQYYFHIYKPQKYTHLETHHILVLSSYAKKAASKGGLGAENTQGYQEGHTTQVILENRLHW